MRRLALPALVALTLFCRPAAHELTASDLPEPARWLQQYLRIDTTNPPGREHLAAAFLARILENEGIPAEIVVTGAGRANVVARLDAPGTDDALVLLHHMDVVPAGDEPWQRPPFAGELAEGALWGRGAVDAKSLGIAQLAAIVAAKRDPRPLARDVLFVAVADEEAGGTQGTGWLLEHRPELFRGAVAVLNEGGANRFVNGRLLWWGLEVAQKRPLWLEVVARGRGGHAAGFHPDNPVHRLVRALDRVVELPPAWRVTPAARTYLQALAPLHNETFQKLFRDPDAYVDPEGPNGPMMPGMSNLFLDTVQVTVIEAGEQINVVPPEARARIDVRMLPDTDAEALLARLREALGREVAVEVLLTSPPAEPSPADGPVWRLLDEGLPGAPVVPFFSSGFTDSRYFRARDVPAYGFSPFALGLEDLWGIHAEDERMPVDELVAGVERYVDLVAAWAH